MLFVHIFHSSKNLEKKVSQFHNINSFQHWWYNELLFLKDHVTLKTGVMMLKNSALHNRNKLHFKIYLNRKQLFLNIIIFHNISVKFSLSKQKKNLSDPILLNSSVWQLYRFSLGLGLLFSINLSPTKVPLVLPIGQCMEEVCPKNIAQSKQGPC